MKKEKITLANVAMDRKFQKFAIAKLKLNKRIEESVSVRNIAA